MSQNKNTLVYKIPKSLNYRFKLGKDAVIFQRKYSSLNQGAEQSHFKERKSGVPHFHNSSFKDDTFVPSSQLNYYLTEFKLNFSNSTLTNDHLIQSINNTKRLIERFSNDCSNNIKFDKMMHKIEYFIIQIFINLQNEKKFESLVDFYLFLVDSNYNLNNNQIDDILKNVLMNHDVSSDLKYKLLTSSNITPTHDTKSISYFREPLDEQNKQRLIEKYSPTTIMNIILHFYIPLNDKEKTNEYLYILREKIPEQKFQSFRLLADILVDTTTGIMINEKGTIKDILNGISFCAKNNAEVFQNFDKDLWHQIFIDRYVSPLGVSAMYQYIKFFYSDILKNSESLEFYRNYKTEINPSFKTKFVSFMPNDKDNTPTPILSLFFDNLIIDCNHKRLCIFVEELNKLGNQEYINIFSFSILKNLSALKKIHSESTSGIDIIPNKKISLLSQQLKLETQTIQFPKFQEVNILSDYSYYENSPSLFNRYLELKSPSSQNTFKILNIESLKKLLILLSDIEIETLMKTLISNNYLFGSNLQESSDFLNSYMEKNPSMSYFILSGGTSLERLSKINQSRLDTLLDPVSVLKKLINLRISKLECNRYLDYYHYFKNDINYKILGIQLLQISQVKFRPLMNLFMQYLKDSNLKISNVEKNDQIRIYTAFIKHIIQLDGFTGLLIGANLIEKYKHYFTILSGATDDVMTFQIKNDEYVYKENLEVPFNLVMAYIEKYVMINISNSRLLSNLFKNSLLLGKEIKDEKLRDEYNYKIFQYFQMIYIKHQVSPYTFYKLYDIADSFKLKNEWKVKFDKNSYLINYFKYILNEKDDESKKNKINLVKLKETLIMISMFESNLEFPDTLISKIFNVVDQNNKKFTLKLLRNTLLYIPYCENINSYIYPRIKESDPAMYEIFGLDSNEPSVNNEKSRRSKWMVFDVRYYSSIIEKFMEELISKEDKLTIKTMMTDSIAISNNNELNINLKFYQLFNNVTLFEPNKVNNNVNLYNFNEFLLEFNKDFENKGVLQDYLIKPFVYHYLFTRMYSYDLETIIKMFYILTNGDKNLEIIGLFDLLGKDELKEIENINIDMKYSIETGKDYVNIFKLLFTMCKNSESIEINKLMYMINLSENLLKSEKINDKYKYVIMNCSLVLVGKHSDLISIFFKRIIDKNYLPDYKVSKTVLYELLYSVVKNSISDIDKILNHLTLNISTLNYQNLYISSESVIKKLIDENEFSLAQEFYIKMINKFPKFRINELHESLNVTKAKIPHIKIDENDAVNMKVDKFKVKLYDYESLDK